MRAEAEAILGRAEEAEVKTGWDHYMLAREYRVRGEPVETLASLRRATALDPKLVAGHYMLGNCLLEDARDNPNQMREAVAAYHAAIALEPDFAGLYYNRGLALFNLKKFAEAEEDFSRAVELRPDIACFRVQRALAREKLAGDKPAREKRVLYREALADADEAIRLGNRGNQVRFLRAGLRERLGDKEGAAEDRRAGLESEPRAEGDWIARGKARYRAGDVPGALEDFQKAVEANPRSLVGLHNQAHIYSERLGKNDEAIERLNRVLDCYPDLLPSLGGRAVLLARQGRRDQALADAKRLLALSESGQFCYQAACVLALTSQEVPADRDRAFTLLSRALQAGYGHELFEEDLDLAPLWQDPRFAKLKATIRTMRQESRKTVF
jgi:tetratricopeptide (TPR) repeat protein